MLGKRSEEDLVYLLRDKYLVFYILLLPNGGSRGYDPECRSAMLQNHMNDIPIAARRRVLFQSDVDS